MPEIDRAQLPQTPIAEDNSDSTLGAALAAVPRFGLKPAAAKAILREVLAVIVQWRKTGRQLRLKSSTLDAYATAFDHPLVAEAKKLT